jgi:hypothetical protein
MGASPTNSFLCKAGGLAMEFRNLNLLTALVIVTALTLALGLALLRSV